MTPRELAFHLLQDTYYDSIDRGDMEKAASALHEEVEWSHQQVWSHHDFQQGRPSLKRGSAVVGAFLAERREKLAEAKIRHHVRDLVCEENRGAMLGYVLGPDGTEQSFMVWFEIRDGKLSRYLLRPL